MEIVQFLDKRVNYTFADPPIEDEESVCVIYDHSCLSLVADYLRKNIDDPKPKYCVCVPLSENNYTYAQHVLQYGYESRPKLAKMYPENHLFRCERMYRTRQKGENESWPSVKSDHLCVEDVIENYTYYVLVHTLPDVLHGTSIVQRYAEKLEEEDEQVAAACTKFFLPFDLVKRHIAELYNRNIPYGTKTHLPKLLCNGHYPIDPAELCSALAVRAKRVTVNFDTLTAKYKGLSRVWETEMDDGWIVKLPYGCVVPMEDYEDESTFHSLRIRGPRIDMSTINQAKKWKCFDGEQIVYFENINDYVTTWFYAKIKECAKDVEKMLINRVDEKKQKFIQRIYLHEPEVDINGKQLGAYFIGRSKRVKLDILKEEYGHTDFANIPISEFGPECLTKPPNKEPIDAHELLEGYLQKELPGWKSMYSM